MNVRKIVILLLALKIFTGSYFVIKYFHVPDPIDFFQIVLFSKEILVLTSLGFLIVCLYRIFKNKEFDVDRVLKFPLFLNLIDAAFYFPFVLYSAKSSYFGSGILVLKLLDLVFILVTMYYFMFLHKSTTENQTTKPVGRLSRFITLSIDTVFILIFTISSIALLSYETIIIELDVTNGQSVLFYSYHSLIYYFILEMSFAQTIGKLHNDSFVKMNKSRLVSITLRTICRKIPFDPLSFLFGRVGWHDSISETSVVNRD
jgi:hypothetical protein